VLAAPAWGTSTPHPVRRPDEEKAVTNRCYIPGTVWRKAATKIVSSSPKFCTAFQTRRTAIEQAEYERARMADPEKIRQEQLSRELDHARVSPPLTEVWSGKSLNVLLRNAIARQA
jgi:hypothetical protein